MIRQYILREGYDNHKHGGTWPAEIWPIEEGEDAQERLAWFKSTTKGFSGETYELVEVIA